nr:hypothetical protein [uncultured Cetobacterium sp.]
MYRVQLVEDKEVLKYKDFQDYDEAFNYSNSLISEIKEGRKILLLENKTGKIIRKLEIEKS